MQEYNTIEIDVGSTTKILEGNAFEGIFPGQICALTDQLNDAYEIQSINDRRVPAIIATNNIYLGLTITDPYAVTDRIFLRWGRSGDVFLGVQEPAAISSKGDYLRNNSGFVVTDGDLSRCAFVCLETTVATTGNHFVLMAVI
jgi:hypothetical protein